MPKPSGGGNTLAGQPVSETPPNDGDVLVYVNASSEWQSQAPASGDGDERVKISANDTTAGFLDTKLVAGDNIDLVEQNDGGNESLEVSVPEFNSPPGSAGVMPSSSGQENDAVLQADGAWNVPFGSDFYYAESEGVSTNSTTTPQVKVTLSDTFRSGMYKLEYSFELNHSAVNQSAQATVRQSGAVVMGQANIEPKDSTNWYACAGMRQINLSGADSVDIVFNRDNPGGGSISRIRRARISLTLIELTPVP